MRAFFNDLKGNWDDYLHLIEFSHNNRCHSSIAMAPFEELYGRKFSVHVGWFYVVQFALSFLEILYEVVENVM